MKENPGLSNFVHVPFNPVLYGDLVKRKLKIILRNHKFSDQFKR